MTRRILVLLNGVLRVDDLDLPAGELLPAVAVDEAWDQFSHADVAREVFRENLRSLLQELPSVRLLAGPWERRLEEIRPHAVWVAWMPGDPWVRLRKSCARAHIPLFVSTEAADLAPLDTIVTQEGTPYKVFGPFAAAVRRYLASLTTETMGLDPWQERIGPWPRGVQTVPFADLPRPTGAALVVAPHVRRVCGGRQELHELLHRLDQFGAYETTRNNPSHPTTLLGAHLRDGTVSPRIVWRRIAHLFGPEHSLCDQLLWRTFFRYLAFHRPESLKGQPLREEYRKLSWRHDHADFRRWTRGETGVPFVDAGMRELRTTGWMHNRLRMVTSQFLTKNLRIDWTWGDAWFQKYLVDYDPALNAGNWSWNAGVGADPESYGKPRVFDPSRQLAKYDPEGEYTRRWIPTLANVPLSDIIHWEQRWTRHPLSKYPGPMVPHRPSIQATLAWFLQAKRAHSTWKSSLEVRDAGGKRLQESRASRGRDTSPA